MTYTFKMTFVNPDEALSVTTLENVLADYEESDVEETVLEEEPPKKSLEEILGIDVEKKDIVQTRPTKVEPVQSDVQIDPDKIKPSPFNPTVDKTDDKPVTTNNRHTTVKRKKK